MQNWQYAPTLANVICKVKLQQPLMPEEEKIYLVNIEGLSEEDPEALVRIWYDLDDKKTSD